MILTILSLVSLTIPTWAVTTISLVISTAITATVGYIIKRSLDKYFKSKEFEQKTLESKLRELETYKGDQMREQRREDMEEIVNASLEPVNKKIDSLIDIVAKTEEGTLSSLRNDILTCYYRCCKKGYRGDWDFENIHHLFEAYKSLNGNSFVRDVMVRFDELPSKEEYLKTHKDKKIVEVSDDEDF